METRIFTTIDKSDWQTGEWQNEPDKMQWPDPATGLPCLLVRNPHLGNLCGYVGVTEEHPLFGLGYDATATEHLEAHGGLTFAGPCDPAGENIGICHIPGRGETDNVWWFGFDCGHWNDRSMLLKQYEELFPSREFMGVYRNVAYVQAECASLAKAAFGNEIGSVCW